MFLNALFQNGMYPVSYTHLDVYKRQVQDFVPFPRKFLLPVLVQPPSLAPCHALCTVCLLYTSRCV